MQQIKNGKEEIIYLLTLAIQKYKLETGQEIIQNTNRKNYEALAIVLSEISNQLPLKSKEWGTEDYTIENTQNNKEYPYRKYDLTGGQIKDALSGIVSHPRPFLIDACYVYLFNMGRKSFEQNPIDENLLVKTENEKKDHIGNVEIEKNILQQQNSILLNQTFKSKRLNKHLIYSLSILTILFIVFGFYSIKKEQNWTDIKNDMNIIPYQPTQSDIDSLEGIWLCYTGSPQARISNPKRYHVVVSNIINIQYKNGYFTYNRFGASFNHVGFMQFESEGLVSVYSRIKNKNNNTESPRHSLLNLKNTSKYLPAISASWSFDIGDKNKIIGIREVYIKLGKGGTIEEIINSVENASCQCKIVRWHQPNKPTQTFYLKNIVLDSLKNDELKSLIDEKSILLNIPQEGVILGKESDK